jgi:hypothetical protein
VRGDRRHLPLDAVDGVARASHCEVAAARRGRGVVRDARDALRALRDLAAEASSSLMVIETSAIAVDCSRAPAACWWAAACS